MADFSRPEGRLCIDGAFRDAASGAVCENINPATEEVIGQVADAAAADLDAAIGRRADS